MLIVLGMQAVTFACVGGLGIVSGALGRFGTILELDSYERERFRT